MVAFRKAKKQILKMSTNSQRSKFNKIENGCAFIE